MTLSMADGFRHKNTFFILANSQTHKESALFLTMQFIYSPPFRDTLLLIEFSRLMVAMNPPRTSSNTGISKISRIRQFVNIY